MGPTPNKNVKTAPKLKLLNFEKILGAVSLFGKPLYKVLYALVFFVLFIAYFIGKHSRKTTRETIILFEQLYLFLTEGFIKVYSKIEVKLPPAPPIPKITLPKKSARTTKKLVKLIGLKLNLQFLIIINVKTKLRKIKIRPLSIASILLVLIFLTVAGYLFIIARNLPSPQKLIDRNQQVSTKIYDRGGKLLFTIYKDQNRSPVDLMEIPLHVRLATLAAEDAEFYHHPGFSPKGIARAVIKNIKSDQLEGGSTITQQLVKNALLSSEKTLIRKVREIITSVRVEFAFSKDEILEMYLNEVSYGGTAYGIQEASRVYFDKDVSKLTLAEAALLAGLPKSPTKYSPFGANPEEAIARQREVLRLMRINKFITREQQEEALNQKLTFSANKINIEAPHFVMYVKQQLVEKYGEEMIEKGGLSVTTTLDYEIQKLAESVVAQEVESLSALNVTNAAVVILDPKTGEILAMVGSKDYFDTEADGNVNVATRLRQPGSSIKVVNYAYALSNSMTAASVINDSPITFNIPGQPPYSPRNYDNQFRGNLTVRSALAESRNVPAVKILAINGVDKMIETGRKMGITTWNNPDNYGLSLTLGGGEVRLIDLAQVYATLANNGKKPDIIATKSVTNHKGKVLEENDCEQLKNKFKIATFINQVTSLPINPIYASQALDRSENQKEACWEQVIDERVAYILTDILKDNNARAPAFGTHSALVIPNHREVAVKTGTSNDLRDNLTVGYNQDYLVAVWVGNNDNSPMARVASGITGASPIWNKIMSALLEDKENHNWEIPENLVQLPICTLTGTLTCTGCPTRNEWFLTENAPTRHCSPETIKQIYERRAKNKEGSILPGAASTEIPN